MIPTGTHRVLVSDSPGETRWALLEGDRILEVVVQWDHAPEAGAVLAGRLGKRGPGGGAVFVDLGTGPAGFLPLADLPGKAPPEGALLAVQVVQEARGAKGPKLTAKVTLPGRLLVFTPFAPGLGLSPKAGTSAQRTALRARIEPLLQPGEGAIARTAAGADGVRDSALRADLDRNRALWAQATDALARDEGPGPLLPAPAPLVGWLNDLGPAIETVLADRGDRVPALAALAKGARPDWTGSVALDPDAFARLGVEDALEGTLAPRVPLPGGGALIIEDTQALTAIDVDTGGADPEAVSRAAPAMVAHQIRLRGLAGQILLDLPRRKGGVDREAVAALEALLAQDPAGPRLLGVTRGGLVEIVRPRARPPLSERLLAPVGARPPAPDARLLARLRTLLRDPGPTPTLTVTPAEDALLRGPLTPALEQARVRLGQEITLVRRPPGLEYP
jgi:Rne/Rng family ribonuclease